MVSFFWNNWLLIAVIPPMLYAIVSLFDAYWIDRQVFDNAREATIISALFGALPLLAPIFGIIEIQLPAPKVTGIALLSGVAFALHIYYYLAALFEKNDVVLAETIQNLSVLCVPFLAYFLIDEILTSIHYVGIGVATLGVVFMYCHNKSSVSGGFAGCGKLVVSMLLFSLTLIAGEWVYRHTSFWDGYMIFSLGMFITGFGFFLFGNKKTIPKIVCSKWRFFFLAEGLTTIGILCSQRAVDISPSVTFIAITECLVAFFILMLSLGVFWFARIAGGKLEPLGVICKNQLIDYPGKIVAGLFISTGILLVYTY
ncbi:MAG: EamA family transporter [Arenicellales bacterium]